MSETAVRENARTVVVGGGVAGIYSALLHADRGRSVTLLESRPRLGGRAFTLPEKEGALPADNGPHVILGRYRAFRRLLRRLGTEKLFEQRPTLKLDYVDENGKRSKLALGPGPAPLWFPIALLRCGALPLLQRFRALLGLAAVLLGASDDLDAGRWSRRFGQQGGPRDLLWDPMSRAIMNAELEDISAGAFLKTLQMAFLGSGREAAIWLPKAPWSEILGDAAERALDAAGVEVQTGARVRALESEEGRVTAIVLGDDARIDLEPDDQLVIASPWRETGSLLGDEEGVPDLAPSSIVSVYFECESADGVDAEGLVGLIGPGPFDFLCRRAGEPLERFALLSGGGRGLDGLSTTEIAEAARKQLQRCYPTASGLGTAKMRVTKEARATFVAAPGVNAGRPLPGRSKRFSNVSVVGDWTRTGVPSTLEGAALSAELAVGIGG